MTETEPKSMMITVETACNDIPFVVRLVLKSIERRMSSRQSGSNHGVDGGRDGLAAESACATSFKAGQDSFEETKCRINLFRDRRASIDIDTHEQDHIGIMLGSHDRLRMIASIRVIPPTSAAHFLFLMSSSDRSDFMGPIARAMSCLGPAHVATKPATECHEREMPLWTPVDGGRISTMADMIRDPEIGFHPEAFDFSVWRQAAETWGNWQRPLIGLEPDLIDELMTMNPDDIQGRLKAVMDVDTAPAPRTPQG